jgi:hypothetical protein
MSDDTEPFQRDESLDKPGIVGARWWQKSLETAPDLMSRRKAVQGILIGAGVVASLGMVMAIAGAASSGSSDYRTEARAALDMQKEYGWSFGAANESLTFDGQSTLPFDRDALRHLADDLRPRAPAHAPWYVPTLFQSPSAVPRSLAQEDTTPITPLAQALVPMFTAAMDVAYRRGKALASLFQGESPAAMVVVDLPGPEAIAFAAGAAAVLDPVFALDNWPHPRGVVAAHRALAAAVYYQPLFARRSAATGAPPLVVLDQRRLSPYTDDATQFDNRHVARLPGAASLRALGITRVLYVAPTGSDRELDDLNDDFVLYTRAGLEVRLCGADAFGPDPGDGAQADAPYYYGAHASSHGWFWHDYPWVKRFPSNAPPKSKPPTAPSVALEGPAYAPAPRATAFSSGAPSATSLRPRPSGFGTVPVIVSIATGLILGAKLFRSGSWNRASGGWGG